MLNQYPCCRKDDIVMQNLDEEILIYDLKTNKAFCLNKTSALVWRECDGTKSLSEISEKLSIQFNTQINQGLIWLALEQLKKENLIESEVSLPSEYKGKSRREIIKQIGFSAAIVFPMISSLVAPHPINAASTACTAGAAPNGAAGTGGFCRCVFPGTLLGATCGVGDAAFSTGETCKPGCICTHSNFGNGTCG